MQTIGLRRLLPILAFLAMGALLGVQTLDQRVVARRTSTLLREPATAADPIIEEHALPVPMGVLSIMALPGLLPFALLGITPTAGTLRAPGFVVGVALMTAIAWYLAGRWADKRLGFLRRSPHHGFYFLDWVLLITWIGALCSITAVLLDIDFLGEMRWMAAGVVLWGMFVAVVLASRIRDYHVQAETAKAASSPSRAE